MWLSAFTSQPIGTTLTRTTMSMDSETTPQVSQDLLGPSLVFLGFASRASSDAPAASTLGFSYFHSPVKDNQLKMYASPSPLKYSQHHQKLSPALAATPPHLFTPLVPLGISLTPGLSPIDHSPRPSRARTLACSSPCRPFFQKLLDARDGSDSDSLSFVDDCNQSLPRSPSVHLGCTSTPPRETPRPSLSPFSSPLSSSSLDIPLSCTPASRRLSSPVYVCKEHLPTTPPFALTQKRPASTRPPIRRANANKRLRVASLEPSPSLSAVPSQRIFPPSVQINPEFPGFYIRFPVIPPVLKAYVLPLGFPPLALTAFSPSGCTLNPPRDVFDLYTPRLVRGSGHTKVGLCPICACTGTGKVWLSMKFSAYKWCVPSYPASILPFSHLSDSVSLSFPYSFLIPFSSRVCDSYHMQYFH